MKTKTQVSAILVMTALVLTSCTQAPEPVDLEKLRAEIQNMEDAYAAAEKAKDAEGVAVYYSDDAVTYSRNEAPTSGKAAIKERIAQRLANDTTGNYNVYKVVELFAEGDQAVEIGSWTVLTPSGAEVEKGHYMSYFQKRNGKYFCVRDMNVTSEPVKEGL